MTVRFGRRLRVDLATGRSERRNLEPADIQRFLGGRGTNIAALLAVRAPFPDPLSPEAPLLFGTGPLVGTSFPGGARFNVSARSPQTRILGDSNAGGFFGPELRFAGVDTLEIAGRAERPSILWIDDGEVHLLDARGIWGHDTVETTSAVLEMLGDTQIQVAAIGPAAERGVRYAGVFVNLVRAAARTGMGTVMASKNLKAIAVRGTGGVSVADPARFEEGIERLQGRILAHPEYAIRKRMGTTQLVSALQRIGGLPSRHFQSGTFAWADRVSGERIEAKYKIRGKACFACSIPCSRILHVEDSRFPSLRFEGPEYEPLAGFSIRVGCADLPLALHAVDRCNRLGLDAISTSEAIAWTMECVERGMLSAKETDGLEVRFGSGEAVLALIEQIAARDGFGDLLADGVRAAAERLNVGREIAMHVKGLELFQADVRAMKAYALGNAVSSRGADHLRSEPWFEFSGDREAGVRRYGEADTAERLAWRGKGCVVQDFEEKAAVADALGVCKNTYNNMEVLDWSETAELLSATLGGQWTGEAVREVGERIVNAERMFNARFGIGRKDDTLPSRFLNEPASPPDSPSAGSVVELDAMLDEYYDARGWDRSTGLPMQETIDRLRLED